ncbi:hypothetical protein GFL95_32025 [Rhizobium leguminosarum bv. viciae]|uniref:hypothetical protein n=1 Tax=Rhizobium leguminosarum TaxID=384 RepID=UPI001441F658|nr:hypothetical protein [Rhizobium leguminosarum]NKK95783.1 hypothetical protein [Rhizobium leguminosarum bv. viciae]
MGVGLFQTDVELDDLLSTLAIEFDQSTGTPRLSFSIVADHNGHEAKKALQVGLTDVDSLDVAGFSYDTLDRTYTLTLDLSDVVDGVKFGDRVAASGIAGARFDASATLTSLKLVLRPRPQAGDWASDRPSFTLVACWEIEAKATREWQDKNKKGDVDVETTFEACIGLSVVVPDRFDIGLPNFQVRLDLPPLGLTTDWAPFSWFEWPDLMPLRMEGLLAWFTKLIDFEWAAQLPDVTPPRLPEWDVDLPLSMDLPLGVGVETTRLHLRRLDDGSLIVEAVAEGFYLTWQGRSVTDAYGRIDLLYDGGKRFYTIKVRFFEAQYPLPDAAAPFDPYRFSLPFDLLDLEAECWYLRLGLFLNKSGNGDWRICFEALLEIGGLKVTSRLTGDAEDGLYKTDIRLLLRDTTLVSATLTNGSDFLADAVRGAGENPFDQWKGKAIPALSFANDLRAPSSSDPANEYNLVFNDGEFRVGERIFLLWQMNGRRLLKALAHDLVGREPAGAVGADEAATDFGLELAKQADGATQIRLDWRGSAITVGAPGSGAPEARAGTGNCLKKPDGEVIDLTAFNIPFSSKGTYLDGNFANPLKLELPAISLEVARPRTQSIVLRAEPDQSHSASHLLLFDGMTGSPPDQPAPPLARAKVGFSLKETGEGSDERNVVETKDAGDKPFLTIGLGNARAGDFAVRTVGWRRGCAPRFLEVLPATEKPFRSLIPAQLPVVPNTDPGCPGEKPAPLPAAALDFDAFETPRFGDDAWRLSARLAATDALFKMFENTGTSGQKVSFNIENICIDDDDDRVVLLKTDLTFSLGSGPDAFNATGKVTFRFDLRDLALSVADGASLAFRLKRNSTTPEWTAEASIPEGPDSYFYSEETSLLGLKMTALVPRKDGEAPPDTLDVLTLSIKGGRFVLALPADRAVVLRYTGLGRGSLNFWVTEFVLGPGGLDATGGLIANTLRVKGLKSPFILEHAALRIRASRLEYLSVSGSGVLPELLDEAPVKIAIAFKQGEDSRIDIDSLDAQLGDKGKPIFSRGTRFKFEIEELGLGYKRAPDGGERHFYFELTGSAQFTPESNEFTSGLLENLKKARLDFVRVPLTDEFAEHISLSIELKRPMVFSVFGVFKMEIRSIGFHPKFPEFSVPAAAVIIGGQVEFADTGDVVRAEIDFHAMYIGLPKPDSSVPQVHFDGLRVDISTAEGFRIGGRVDTYKSDTREGFAGEGTVQIPGFPELSAAFAFVRVRETPQDDWLRAWFIGIDVAKISYLVGGALPIYLRQVGLGFGYRYTLPLILEFDKHKNLADLIAAMLRAVDKHQTLASIDSWQAETRGRRWTIAVEALLSLGSANSSPFDYNEKAERELRTIFTHILAAYRSDFTLVAAAKLWFPVSVDDFFRNVENMRERPLATGFFAFSATQNRLLAHVRKNQDAYLGQEKDQPIPYLLKLALEKSYFEATLLIEPGLVHAELGWPDRLGFDLTVGPMRVGCRAGILMRLERDMLIYGYYFSAYGELNLGGGVDFGFVGVRVEALVRVQYATRLLIGANTRKPLSSNIYGAIGLDIAVRFLIRAWLRLDFRFFKISIDISFSFNLQLSVLGEIGWAGQGELGFRGQAQFVIGVFGRSLAVKIDVGVNKGAVAQAKSALEGYAGSFLEPGKAPPAMPGIDDGLGARKLDRAAVLSLSRASRASLQDLISKSAYGIVEPPKDSFVTACVESENRLPDGEKLFFAWIMPGPNGKRFYQPTGKTDKAWIRYANLSLPEELLSQGEIFYSWEGAWRKLSAGSNELRIKPGASVKLDAQSGGEAGGKTLTLEQLIAGCYIPNFDDIGTDPDLKENFPLNWPDVQPGLSVAKIDELGERVQDARIFDLSHPSRGPRRMLDEANSFDRAILNSLEAAGSESEAVGHTKDDVYFREQALSNQSLLLQGFYDDLTRIARTTKFSGAPVTPALGDGRPTLFDIGLLICVKAKDLPAWLGKRDDGAVYPELTFETLAETYDLKPAVEAEHINFATNPPIVRDAAAYFDEEVIALAWRLDWGGTAPKPGEQLADGAVADIDHFVRTYEISVVDFNTQRVVHKTTAKTCDVVSSQGDENVRLARYSYTVARDEILPRDSVVAGRQLIATVTPVSQTGTRGASFSLSLDLTPVMTPLPADDAQLNLRYAEKGKTWGASMRWRQPMLPQAAGVARTVGWQLILRPLADVPLGAYPEEALDHTERGLMNTTGQALIEGDIIVPLVLGKSKAPFTYVEVPVKDSASKTDKRSDGVDDLPPAEKILLFEFTKPTDAKPAPFFDHTGNKLPEHSSLYKAAYGFFQGLSANARAGRSWRLFLRAVTDSADVAQSALKLHGAPVSGLSPVTLAMFMTSSAAEAKPRPLPYFEWPAAIAEDPLLKTVDYGDFRAEANLLHVPVANAEGDIAFVPKPGRERAVTVTWNATPAGKKPGEAMPLAAVASYTVHETNLDGLINFDLATLGERAKRLRRIVPTDPAQARLHPSAMSDTQNWEAQYPVFARTRAHLAAADVKPEEMGDQWPGTYSWAESELEWPERLTADEQIQLRQHDKLGGLIEIGEGIARAPVHPFLALLLARLHDLKIETVPRLQVEVSLGPPPAILDPTRWLDANSALSDPYGWASLTPLGLATVFSLRDPITGVLIDQGRAFDRLSRARKSLLSLFDSLKDTVPLVERLRKIAITHLMVELPLQHPQAYRASPDTARKEDVGLALVQVSLRPVPRQIAQYGVIRIVSELPRMRTFALDQRNPQPKSQIQVRFAGVDREAIEMSAEQMPDIRQTFKVDDRLIVREFGTGGRDSVFRQALERYFRIDVDPIGTAPADRFLLGSKLATMDCTPYGRFDPLPGMREWLLQNSTSGGTAPAGKIVPPGYSEHYYRTWIDYIAEAFARPAAGDDAPNAREKAVEALTQALLENSSLFDSYRTWSARMFATAPIDKLFERSGVEARKGDGLATAIAVVQPKSVEPVQIAVDGRGKLRMTRFFREEWATARSYSVSWEGRYDRLAKALQRNAVWAQDSDAAREAEEILAREKPLPANTATRDIFLPRVRALEPPAILSARSVRATDGRPFNEVVVVHSELRLSESNSEVAAKLEFGDIRRHYERSFTAFEYIRMLKQVETSDHEALLKGVEIARALTVTSDWTDLSDPPDLMEHDQTLLFVAPAARWGATRYQDAAEPFYYRQTVTVEAVASRSLMTQGHSIVMPSAQPDQLVPLGSEHSAAGAASVERLLWSDFWPPTGLDKPWTDEVQALRVKRFENWSVQIRASADPNEELITYMHPSGYSLLARLPRYAESLSPSLRLGPFKHELAVTGQTAPAGLLPDADARLLFADMAPGQTFAAIAQVVPVLQTPASKSAIVPSSEAFRATTLSSDFETRFYDVRPYPAANWTGGLFAPLSIRPAFAAAMIDHMSNLPVGEIDKLTNPSIDKLLEDDELPNAGPLVALTPLAIRLFVAGPGELAAATKIGLASQLVGPRWLFRPSLVRSSQSGESPVSQEDLFIALRLLLDHDRRRVAALVAFDAIAKAQPDMSLLDRIERSAFAIVLPQGAEIGQIMQLIALGFDVFERRTEDGLSVWYQVDNDIQQADNWKIVLVGRYTDTLSAEVVDEQMQAFFGLTAHAVDKRELDNGIGSLAGSSYRSTSMREPRVFAQRGNEPPVPWQGKQ